LITLYLFPAFYSTGGQVVPFWPFGALICPIFFSIFFLFLLGFFWFVWLYIHMNTAAKVLTETIATWNILDIAIRLVSGIIGCI